MKFMASLLLVMWRCSRQYPAILMAMHAFMMGKFG